MDSPSTNPPANPFRALPSVAAAVAAIRTELAPSFSDQFLTALVQDELDRFRARLAAGESLDRDDVMAGISAAVSRLARPRLEPVINATGVIIHTNLGRAPVSEATAAAMAAAASSALPLEIDPDRNQRGGRMEEITGLLRGLTGAEAALVVNNNAAAVLLVLSALGAGRSVIVSRGEAVEIGGGFRIPDVLRQSGATLVEVGTTNRTYARDYEAAIDSTTAMLLKVHPSNFLQLGFTATTPTADLAPIATAHGIALVDDLGSGALLDVGDWGLQHEATIGESIAAGASLVTASGDKLLGGPQAGLVIGERRWVEQVERHPLARALRADKVTLAGIAATLRHYADGCATGEIPVWRMITASPGSLETRARTIVSALAQVGIAAEAVPSDSTTGGGSLPGQVMPSWAVQVTHDQSDRLAQALRSGQPRVFGRFADGRLGFDLRTVLAEQDDVLRDQIVSCCRENA